MSVSAASEVSVSFVLLAFNEEASIRQAIVDCRDFGRSHCQSYEIIVIDDGSTDATSQVARETSEGDVVLLVHQRNLGMGAAMRDGYHAASKSYIAHLPGDRQVRANCLREMLPLCKPGNIVVSTFLSAPSGSGRAMMSMVFRVLIASVGGFRVNFAGTYLFHRDWLEKIDVRGADSETFLYSFQLLELFRRGGATFSTVAIKTYLREQGSSRVATLPRIAQMLVEIGRARLKF